MSTCSMSLIRQRRGKFAVCRRRRRAAGLAPFFVALLVVPVLVMVSELDAQERNSQDGSETQAVTDTERDAVLDLETISRVDPHMTTELETQSWLTFGAASRSLVGFRNSTGTRGARGAFWRWDLESKKSRNVAPASVGSAFPQLLRTPDGKTLIVSNSPNGTIAVLDSETLQRRKAFVGHRVVETMSLSPNGRWLASLGRQGNILLWDLQQDQPRPNLLRTQVNRGIFHKSIDGNSVTQFAPLNDGRGVIFYKPGYGDDRQLRLIPADGGEAQVVWKPAKGENPAPRPFALSPDGTLLLMQISLIDLTTGQVKGSLPIEYHRVVDTADWSPDGKRLAVAVSVGQDNPDRQHPNVLIWNVEQNRQEALLVNTFDGDFEINDLEFSPDGKKVLAEGSDIDFRFIVWNVDPPTSEDAAAAVSATDSAMPSRGAPADANEAAEVRDIKPRLQFKTSPPDAEYVHFLDNDRIFTKSLFIDLTTGLQQKVRPGYWKHYNVSMKSSLLADGKTMIAFDNDEPEGRYVLDAPEAGWQEIPANLKSRVDAGEHGRITLLEATPDGQFAAAFTGYGSEPRSTDYVNRPIHIWSIRGQQTSLLGKLSRLANAMVFSNKNYLVTGGDNGDVAIWRPATQQEVLTLTGLQGRIWSVDVSADNAKIAAAGDRGTGIWTAAKEKGGEPVFHQLTAYGTRYVKFSPSGKWAFVFYSEGAPELIETATGRAVARFEINGVTGTSFGGCAFSPDESTLAIAGHNEGFRGVQVYSLP